MTRADTPPMGWNSWDCYGTSVTEDEVMANASFMAGHLLPFGWDTVVVDIQWYEPGARAGGYNDGAELDLDGYGRQLPATNRFPSAAGGLGFTPLADRIHGLGLKFGLHIMRGIPRQAVRDALPVERTDATANQVADTSSVCDWNTDNYGLDHSHPGAQAYYDSQLRLFASWGVDFIKADDMLGPYFAGEIAAYRRAIHRSGRDMVLSLSPGRALSLAHLDHLRTNADMWRVSDDLWDSWEDVEAPVWPHGTVGSPPKARKLGGRGHAPGGTDRAACRAGKCADHAPDARRTTDHVVALVHRPFPAHARLRPALVTPGNH